MKSLYPIFRNTLITESLHKTIPEKRNSLSFVKSLQRSRSLELLKNTKLLPILRAMKIESNKITISDFSQYSNYRIIPQNSSSFSKIQNYFQFFVELWKWNQIKSLYPIFRNTPITELHREDRNSSFFIKSLRRSKPRASQKLLSILRRVMKMESNEITIPDFSQYSNYRTTPQKR